MACIRWLIFVQVFAVARCYLSLLPEQREKRIYKVGVDDGGDPGEPLFLSPLIAAGRLDEARSRARVTLAPELGVESYAGYLTVNETYQSNQYIWYFPSMVEDRNTAPVLVWLQGGPGGASLYGLFTENGPLAVRNGTIEVRKPNWALNHHLIYIDNPVGAGFSFTKDDRGYCTDETQIADQLYSSVTQFFQLFPELQKNSFFISGESYAGKYVPALAHAIHTKNPTAKTKINLQGIAIGDGWCDPEHQLVYSEYLYQHGLIDWNQKNVTESYEAQAVERIKNQDWTGANDMMDNILSGLEVNCYNYLIPKHAGPNEDYVDLLEKTATRKAIHVGNQPYVDDSTAVLIKLTPDIMKSVAPLISELLEHYAVTFYNGQLDIIVAYPLTVNFLRVLPFSGAAEYARAPRWPWYARGQLAGYGKTAGRLTELVVRDAGHMAPADQPEWLHDLITQVTHGNRFHQN